MKKILFAMLILAVVAMGEEFNLKMVGTRYQCPDVKYNTFTHEFTPDSCVVRFECWTHLAKYGGDAAKVSVIKIPGTMMKVEITLPSGEAKRLSLSDLSMMMSNGALETCHSKIVMDVIPAK